jgi:diaminopimelate epimerase
MLAFSVRAGKRALKGAIVNSGEPHIVVRTDDLSGEDVRALGEAVNADKSRFPTGVNLNMVEVAGPHSIKIRTYERGVYDETLACGTGATAGAAVSLLLGWVKPGPVAVETRGGRMSIELSEDKRAFMTGPARLEFEGTVPVDL